MGNSGIKILGIDFKNCIVCLLMIMGNFLAVKAQNSKILMPKEIIFQYGGSIGFLSVGAGYQIFKNRKGTLDFHYGFVPENKGGTLHVISVKFAYKPFEIALKDWGKIYLANPGMFISYTIGEDLNLTWDQDQYPKRYYWWSPALRPHISLSNELKLNSKKVFNYSGIKTLSFYSEFNTNELYLISHFQNPGGLPLKDIIKLGFGVRIGI
jgi:hypothetical protein